jgi:hypothetical protein
MWWSRAMRAPLAFAFGAAPTDPCRDLSPILANRPLAAGGDRLADPDVDADNVTASRISGSGDIFRTDFESVTYEEWWGG